MRRFLSSILLVFATVTGVVAEEVQIAGASVDSKYLESRPPRRLAIVVGNYEYENLGDLPGVKSDVERVSQTFRDLGFDEVWTAPNVADRRHLMDDWLVPFRKKVERDDLIVLYFSGHGFAYAGYQYFAPARMPRQVPESQVATTALPIEMLIDFFDDEAPGAVLLIVDACRTTGDFVIKDKDGQEVPKGANDGQQKSRSLNYILALSVDRGLPSQASSDPNVMSVYSGALIHEMDRPEDFRLLHDDVEFEVSEETQHNQVPGLYEFSMTDIVLKNSADWLDQERERWESLLSEGDRRKILKFAKRKTLSPYVRAARQWLEDNEATAPVALASVSPSAVEEAWFAEGPRYAFISPLKFPQYEQMTYTNHPHGDPQFSVADILRKRGFVGDVPFSKSLPVAPEQFADWLTTLKERTESGVPIFVDDLQPRVMSLLPEAMGGRPLGWDKYSVLLEDKAGGVEKFEIDRQKLGLIQIGEPASAVELAPRSGAPSGLVDLAPIDDAVSKLRAEKKSITWVSIAAPVPDAAAEDRGEGEAAEADFMVANIQYGLAQLGIDRSRITAVFDDLTVKPGTLRVRIFAD